MVFHSFWSDWRWQQWSHHLLSIRHLREDFSSDIKIIKTHMELLISHDCHKELDDTRGCFLAVTLISTSHITHTNTHRLRSASPCDVIWLIGVTVVGLHTVVKWENPHPCTAAAHFRGSCGITAGTGLDPRPHDCKTQSELWWNGPRSFHQGRIFTILWD